MDNKQVTLQEAIVNILKHYSNEDLNEGKQMLNEGFKSPTLGEVNIEDESSEGDFTASNKHLKAFEKAVKSQFKAKFDTAEVIVGDDNKIIGVTFSKNDADMNYLASLIDGKDKIDSDVTFDVDFGLVVGDFWFNVVGVNPSNLTKFNRLIEAKLVKILRELNKTFF